MKGKEKCKALKEIRRQIAEQNDIPYAVSQCTHKGDCKGTCPKCEAELKYLERELALRQGLGKAVAIAGISVGVCAGLSACGPITTIQESGGSTVIKELDGDMPAPTEYPEEVVGLMVAPEETEPEETEPMENDSMENDSTENDSMENNSMETEPEENDSTETGIFEIEGDIAVQE